MAGATTIAAISSAPGSAARAVVRLSGPEARSITESCCRALTLGARAGHRARLFDGEGEQPVLVLWMPGPGSLTGEDVVEWHLVGSPPLTRRALERALELGAVPARPGEFLRRAFERGRIDLARAEGVLTLVHARSEVERRAATALLLGGLSRRVEALRERLVEVRSLCEAALDFDERDTGGIPRDELAQRAAGVQGLLEEALAWENAREAPLGLPRAVLVGRPNAGKSSLFNRLTGGSVLVSELAGTTRDALTAPWAAGELCFELWDVAGLHAPTDGHAPKEDPPAALGQPERLAQERARAVAQSADLWIWVVDLTQVAGAPGSEAPEGDILRGDILGGDFLVGPWEELRSLGQPPPTLLVFHKADLRPDLASAEARAAHRASLAPGLPEEVRAVLWVSSRTGSGLEALARDAATVFARDSSGGEIRELASRHRAALEAARRWAAEARELLESGAPLDLAAHAERRATDELDQIQGRTTPEDLLDRIFARFCLGK